MRPRDRVDAVHLNKANPLDQVMQGLPGRWPDRGCG